MDFTLSPEQQAVQEKAQRLAQEVKDQSGPTDREGRFPQEILELWAREGLFGLALPREYGGPGLDYVAYVLAQMELAQACPSSALVLHVNHSLFGGALAQFGTEDQKAALSAAGGPGRGLRLLRPDGTGGGLGPRRPEDRRPPGRDGWVLTGRKNFVTSGQPASPWWPRNRPPRGPKGISAFLVDLKATPGVTRGPPEEKMGMRGATSVSLVFEEAPLPGDQPPGGACTRASR